MSNQGYFVNWKITSASVDDRTPAEELLLKTPAKQILSDGGYLSQALQQRLEDYHIHLWFPLRKNMLGNKQVNSAFLKNQRRHIETCLENFNRVGHFEHPETLTLSGLDCRLTTLFLWNVFKVHDQLIHGRSGLKISDDWG